jgi:hypothetical protein
MVSLPTSRHGVNQRSGWDSDSGSQAGVGLTDQRTGAVHHYMRF